MRAISSCAALTLALVGCKPLEDYASKFIEPIVGMRVDQATAKYDRQLAELVAQNLKLEGELSSLKSKVELNEYFAEASREEYRRESAVLSSDCQGYGVARTNLGPVLIACDSLSPYLDGFKLRIRATVLVPIDVKGLKVKVTWIESDPKYKEKGKEYREKEIDTLLTFQPGRYTAFEIPLTPASATGLKKMFVRVTTNEVSVMQPLQNR